MLRMNLIRLLPIVIIICIFSACGRKRAPEPPSIKAELIRELFSAMENGKHEQALIKIARLREIYPENVFLAELEYLERNNLVINNVQSLLDENELSLAEATVKEAINRDGSHETLVNLAAKIKLLQDVDQLLKHCENPEDAVDLARSAGQLKAICKTNEALSDFLPIADTALMRARYDMEYEKKRAQDSLCSDIDIMLLADNKQSAVLLAVLAVAEPEHPTVNAYLEWLEGKRKEAPFTFDGKYRNPE